MPEYYQIYQTAIHMNQSPQANACIEALRAVLDEVDRVAWILHTEDAEQGQMLTFEMTGAAVSQGYVTKLDKTIEACAPHAFEPYVVRYNFDGSDGFDVYGPDPAALKRYRQKVVAQDCAETMANEGAPFAPNGLQSVLEALMSEDCRRHTWLLGRYTDEDQPYSGVIEVAPAEAPSVLEAYLQYLEQGATPQPGWPDSSAFELIGFYGITDLIEIIEAMKGGSGESRRNERHAA